jgi:hypothetical protein
MPDLYLIDHIIEIKESVAELNTKMDSVMGHEERIALLEKRENFKSGYTAAIGAMFALIVDHAGSIWDRLTH